MIRRADAMMRILQLVPAFHPAWDEYVAYWEHQTPGICLDFSAFSQFVHDGIIGGRSLDLPAIFALIELFLVEGDDEVQAGASTCFLENLQNKETPPAAWVPLLGPESIAFCQAWDAFTGVQTPGLPEGRLGSP